MEQIQLNNGMAYDLVSGVFEPEKGKIQITILAGYNTLSDIESVFNNELNIEKLKIIDELSGSITIQTNFTQMDSITKQINYEVGIDEYTTDNGETIRQKKYETVYIILLSKPNLWAQVKNLQETVDFLVLEGLEA